MRASTSHSAIREIDDVLRGRYIQYWGFTTNEENYGSMGGIIGSDNTGGFLTAGGYTGNH